MTWLSSIVYGFVSGLTEFLPISSQAHEVLMAQLFGMEGNLAFFRLLNHLAMALAVYICCRDQIHSLYKELMLSNRSWRNRSRQPNRRSLYDIALVRSAFIPLAVGFFCFPFAGRLLDDMHWISLCLAINGLILFLPPYIRTGNKDSLSMTRGDGVLFGIAAALGVVPGVSRIAACTTVASIRGADRQHSLRWALLLSLPAIAFMLGFDIRDILADGMGLQGLSSLIMGVFGAGFSFLGASLAIQVMRFLSVKAGYSGFCFYCWGAALFTFVLYLL